MNSREDRARQLRELLRIYDEQRRSIFPGDGSQEDVRVLAPALLHRIVGMARSIQVLAERGCNDDAAIILRSLYEWTVTLAWLRVAAQNARRFRKFDYEHRLKAFNHMVALGVASEPLTREGLERELRMVSEPAMPDLFTRASEADRHWGRAGYDEFERVGTTSFEGLYLAVFRMSSTSVHPTLMGVHRYVERSAHGQFVVGNPVEQEARDALTTTPILLAMALFVSARWLGWPDGDDVAGAFEPPPAEGD